jgi:hypothetical protein
MAQLSTDTLAYAQIINNVQTFISSYVENKNVSPKDFDTAYQKLISTIRKSITGPISELDLINKGEIPSSIRFNQFVKNITDDINIINHQFDSLAANYVSSFNNLHDEIESEKSSMQRIRSKIGALELYSGSTSNNITYLGDLLNNMDLVDVNKSTTISLCDISDGIATLPKKDIKKWRSSISIYNKNFNNLSTTINPIGSSNGLSGCNFLYSTQTLAGVTNPFLFQKDSTVIKSDPTKMIDESPVSFLEYEAINLIKDQPLPNDTTLPPARVTRPAYEFHYYTGTGQEVLDWASFDTTKPLKLTVELKSSSAAGDYINYISLIPFFGYDATDLNAQIKNVQVTSIKLQNTNTADAALEVINDGPVFIGADISGANISNYKNYFYNKGIFRFPETLANRVYITFEQPSFQDVKIKHTYWTPYDSVNYQRINTPAATTWHGQTRFNPEATGVLPTGATTITWNKATVIPTVESPNQIKSNTNESVKIDLTYLTTAPVSTSALKLTKGSGFVYFYNKQTLGGIEFHTFKTSATGNVSEGVLQTAKGLMTANTPCVFLEDNQILQDVKIDVENVSITAGPPQVITIKCLEKHGFSVGSHVFMNGTVSTASFNGVYTVASKVDDYTFTVANNNTDTLPVLAMQAALTLACYPCYTKVTLDSTTPPTAVSNLSIVTVTTNPSKSNTESIWLKRNYEILDAKRASLGIRDIFLGKEIYLESAEIISKPFYVSKDVDLLSLEVGEYVPQSNESSTSIDYYISVDDGLKWIQVSPMKKNFVGVPEILSFNQNLDNTNILSQIAYYNSPEIPTTIKSIRFRAIMKKTKNGNSTPILGSYKIGVRFK